VAKAAAGASAATDRTEQLATRVMEVLGNIFPGKSKRETSISSFGQSQIQLENSFLLRKVVTLRTEIDNFKITVDEYEELAAQLVDLNDKLSHENSQLRAQVVNFQAGVVIPAPAGRCPKGSSDDELTKTVHELREAEKEVERLNAEKESNQRLLNLLPLICLSINVCVLLFFGWEHFADFMPSRAVFVRATSTLWVQLPAIGSASLSDGRQQMVDYLNKLSYNLSIAYEKVSRTIAHLIVIAR
jgi:hypothetical protein